MYVAKCNFFPTYILCQLKREITFLKYKGPRVDCTITYRHKLGCSITFPLSTSLRHLHDMPIYPNFSFA